MNYQSKQTGFSLIELMIAMLLGLVIMAGLVNLFLQSKRSFNQNESIARMQEDARFALDTIVTDLSMAGMLADMLTPQGMGFDTTLAIGVDCGPGGFPNWAFSMINLVGDYVAMESVDNATDASAGAAHTCLAAGDVKPGTDILTIKRVAGRAQPVPEAGRVYLRTNGTAGLLFTEPVSAAPPIIVPIPFQDWEYLPVIYYVQNYAFAPGDGMPTLCRKVLSPVGAASSMTTDCLARGVEDLQMEYGIDTDNDGSANVYLAAPLASQMSQVVSAKIYLLVRSENSDLSYLNNKFYTLSNAAPFAPNDNFYRRTFSTTVGIRNLRNLNRLGL
jgi:prepilin-type N-terminal cleavage/methylation domain-containing protein